MLVVVVGARRRNGAFSFATCAIILSRILIHVFLHVSYNSVSSFPISQRNAMLAKSSTYEHKLSNDVLCQRQKQHEHVISSRRKWIDQCTISVAILTTGLFYEPAKVNANNLPNITKSPVAHASNSSTPFKAVNLTAVAKENTINITAYEMKSVGEKKEVKDAIYVNRSDYTIVKVKKDLPKWIPKSWRPREKIEIPNSQILASAIIAGSITEAVRTTVLYPLSTIKTRIQANPKHRSARTWKRKIKLLYVSLIRATRQNDLFAGLGASLAVTVPASGVYFGVRDISIRTIRGSFHTVSPITNIEIALLAAFLADVISLAVRTPADVYILRRQVAKMMPNSTTTNFGLTNSLQDGATLLPAAIITDLPYLLLRLFANWLVTQGNEGLASYEIVTIQVACVVAALTTPFDVTRTRIFVNNYANNADIDPNERTSVLKTMQNITRESETGIQNLYAGWVERMVYFGVGRAWFDPIRIIGYLGIRDALLLRFFLGK